jgi:putative toxin-antitoxin system antitoxin component (TIGR02293 family)
MYMRQMATAASVEKVIRAGGMERVHAIEEGFPTQSLRKLLSDGGITIGDLTRVIAPRRTLERRLKSGGRLSTDESDRLSRFISILDLCTYTFGSREEAMDWLRHPLRIFDDQAPLELMKTSAGSEEVYNLLQRARHGMLA